MTDAHTSMKRERASEVDTLKAWNGLLGAIQVVECALPSQMSAAIAELIAQKHMFDNLMLGRTKPEGA